jgi:uncharacterized Zn finger protein
MASRGKKTLRSSWWAQQWLKTLESFQCTDETGRGKSIARNGKVLDMQIYPGKVTAYVKGNRKIPYKIDIAIKTLLQDEWDKVLNALAGKAIFSAKMLAGEMPDSIEEVFTALDVSLFPKTAADLSAYCTCGDSGLPCRHIAVVYYALALEFARNPFVLFRLRGMDREQIIEAVRRKRAIGSEDVMIEDENIVEDEELAGTMDQVRCSQADSQSFVNYWTGRMKNSDIKIIIEPPLVEQSLLKRLGEPPFFAGKMDMMRQLERDYMKILVKAITVGHKE